MIYLASDWHMFHANIIRYSNRPFANVDEMFTSCQKEVRATLKDGDELIYMGDLCFSKDAQQVYRLLDQLVGGIKLRKFIFLRGNHDYCIDEVRRIANEQRGFDITLLREIYETKWNGHFIVCCHYQLARWNKAHHGSLHAFGHSHLPPDQKFGLGRSVEVGYDSVGKWLLPINEFVDLVKDRPMLGHHEQGTDANAT
jgi:calcineurin-like phosphoesterase family protein